MSPPLHHYARLICLFIEGQPLPQPIDGFPHPWNLLVDAARSAPPSPESRLDAIQALIVTLPSRDHDTLLDGLIPIVLDSLPGPITQRQRELYAALIRLGTAQVRPIAEAAHQDRGHAHRRLQALVSRGLLSREYHHDFVYYRLPKTLSR